MAWITSAVARAHCPDSHALIIYPDKEAYQRNEAEDMLRSCSFVRPRIHYFASSKFGDWAQRRVVHD